MAHLEHFPHRRICYFTGRVQGVGFRYTAQNCAMRHNVHGYVRNMPDGRVELVMEGPDSEMDQLVQDIRQKMNQYIRQLDVTEQAATGEFEQFYVRH